MTTAHVDFCVQPCSSPSLRSSTPSSCMLPILSQRCDSPASLSTNGDVKLLVDDLQEVAEPPRNRPRLSFDWPIDDGDDAGTPTRPRRSSMTRLILLPPRRHSECIPPRRAIKDRLPSSLPSRSLSCQGDEEEQRKAAAAKAKAQWLQPRFDQGASPGVDDDNRPFNSKPPPSSSSSLRLAAAASSRPGRQQFAAAEATSTTLVSSSCVVPSTSPSAAAAPSPPFVSSPLPPSSRAAPNDNNDGPRPSASSVQLCHPSLQSTQQDDPSGYWSRLRRSLTPRARGFSRRPRSSRPASPDSAAAAKLPPRRRPPYSSSSGFSVDGRTLTLTRTSSTTQSAADSSGTDSHHRGRSRCSSNQATTLHLSHRLVLHSGLYNVDTPHRSLPRTTAADETPDAKVPLPRAATTTTLDAKPSAPVLLHPVQAITHLISAESSHQRGQHHLDQSQQQQQHRPAPALRSLSRQPSSRRKAATASTSAPPESITPPRAMSASVSTPIKIPSRRRNFSTDDVVHDNGKSKSFNGFSSSAANSPAALGIGASLKVAASPLTGIALPRLASVSTENIHGTSPLAAANLAFPNKPVVAPAASILINSRRTSDAAAIPSSNTVKSLASPSSEVAAAAQPLLAPGPVVTRIPALPDEKELQRRKEQRERRRAKAREERERREKEALKEKESEVAQRLQQKEEKIWGIPKKAFYMGLGSGPGAINFNAQMAMMAGWGNGTGGSGDFIRAPSQAAKKQKTNAAGRKVSSSSSSKSRTGSKAAGIADTGDFSRSSESLATAGAHTPRSSVAPAAAANEEESEEEPLDPEELAALNAIINTRRSMAAAQALASGEVKLPAPKRSLRPGDLRNARLESQESMDSKPNSDATAATQIDETAQETTGDGSSAAEGGALQRPTLDRKASSLSVPPHADDANCGATIRFAPLPRPSPMTEEASLFGDGAVDPEGRPLEGDDLDFYGDSDDDDNETDSDYDGEDDGDRMRHRWSKYKGKWYLMGLPPGAFRADTYRSWKKWSQEAMLGVASSSSRPGTAIEEPSPTDTTRNGNGLERRLSTGTLGLMSSAEQDRRATGGPLSPPVSEEAPGRSSGEDGRPASSAGSASHKRGRRSRRNSQASAKSAAARSPSAGSAYEEDERARRRQLILASRPGGTGMVTLPDGTKLRARRVEDAGADGGEDIEWGFAGLARFRKEVEEAEGAERDGGAEVASTSGEPDQQTAEAVSAESKDATTALAAAIPPKRQPRKQDSKDSSASSARLAPAAAVIGDSRLKQHSSALGLSAQRAEEVQRRHEQEVASLGAEVLAAVRRRKDGTAAAAAASAAASSGGVLNAISDLPPPGKSVAAAPERSGGRSTTVPTSGDRKPSTSPQASSRRQASPVGLSLRAKTGSRTSLASSVSRTRGPTTPRGINDPTIAFYSPNGKLPRKPDAKGYAVVPLPSELGVRPDRPREGRLWEWSDDDDQSDLSDWEADQIQASVDVEDDAGTEGQASEQGRAPRSEAGRQSDDDELNEEERAEEELRKAAHSRRATTTAAGLERMHVRPGRSAAAAAARGGSSAAPDAVKSSKSTSTEDSAKRQSRLRRQTQSSPIPGQGPDGIDTSRPSSSSSSSAAAGSMTGSVPEGVKTGKKPTLRTMKSAPSGSKYHDDDEYAKPGPSTTYDEGLNDSTEDDDLYFWPRPMSQVLGILPYSKEGADPVAMLAQARRARLYRDKRERWEKKQRTKMDAEVKRLKELRRLREEEEAAAAVQAEKERQEQEEAAQGL